MPDNWYYYIVLVVLLIIMIILGFFIGYHYQGNRDALKTELETAKSTISSLENKIKLDEESYKEQNDEMDKLKEKFDDYVKLIGEKGQNADDLFQKNEDEEARNIRRTEIIKKILSWISNTISYSLPTAEELNIEDSKTAEEYEGIKNN